MEKNRKIVIVTGANKGIGLEIVKELAEKGSTVILTSRDGAKGKKSCEELKKQGIEVLFHQLDVTDGKSIDKITQFLKEKFEKIDVLINNAGIFIDGDKNASNVSMETFRETMETNFYGPLRVSRALIPLLQESEDGRIINMSSGLGALQGAGPGYPSYSISKTALNGLTVKMAAELGEKGIKVNSMCPGWVRTDMGGQNASKSVEEGADTAVWLATATEIPTGKFFRERKEIEW